MFTFSKSIEKSTKKIVFCKSQSKNFIEIFGTLVNTIRERSLNMKICFLSSFFISASEIQKLRKSVLGEKSILSESVKAIAILLNQTFFDITKTCLFIKLSENIGKSYLTNPQQKPYINNEDRISSLFSEPSRFSK